jgi:hypothetical protein
MRRFDHFSWLTSTLCVRRVQPFGQRLSQHLRRACSSQMKTKTFVPVRANKCQPLLTFRLVYTRTVSGFAEFTQLLQEQRSLASPIFMLSPGSAVPASPSALASPGGVAPPGGAKASINLSPDSPLSNRMDTMPHLAPGKIDWRVLTTCCVVGQLSLWLVPAVPRTQSWAVRRA